MDPSVLKEVLQTGVYGLTPHHLCGHAGGAGPTEQSSSSASILHAHIVISPHKKRLLGTIQPMACLPQHNMLMVSLIASWG